MEADMKVLVYDDALDAPNAGQCQACQAGLHYRHVFTAGHFWGGVEIIAICFTAGSQVPQRPPSKHRLLCMGRVLQTVLNTVQLVQKSDKCCLVQFCSKNIVRSWDHYCI